LSAVAVIPGMPNGTKVTYYSWITIHSFDNYQFADSAERALATVFCLKNDDVYTYQTVEVTSVKPIDQVKLYPNPVNSRFNIQATGDYQISITDLAGRILATYKLTGQASIDVSWLNPGVYFVKFENSNGTELKKIIKQ
jgi:hypothetical protein